MKRTEGEKSERDWTLSWPEPLDLLSLRHGVEHRGHLYPARFEAAWQRGDGLRVALVVRVDRVLGPLPDQVVIEGLPGGVASAMRGLPVAAMASTAAAQRALDKDAASGHWVMPGPGCLDQKIRMGPVPRPPARKGAKPERLRQVAVEYYQAVREGAKVGDWVRRQLGAPGRPLSRSQAYALIHQARTTKDPKTGRTYLPPTDQGKKASLNDLTSKGRKP
jgi:hypothetical protein